VYGVVVMMGVTCGGGGGGGGGAGCVMEKTDRPTAQCSSAVQRWHSRGGGVVQGGERGERAMMTVLPAPLVL